MNLWHAVWLSVVVLIAIWRCRHHYLVRRQMKANLQFTYNFVYEDSSIAREMMDHPYFPDWHDDPLRMHFKTFLQTLAAIFFGVVAVSGLVGIVWILAQRWR